jgi:release factor glutamine methyltransferase
VDAPAYEARILVGTFAAARDREPDPRAPLGAAAASAIAQALCRRLAGEPLWRILGEREFWGLTFRLSPQMLEPRPDTETLVDAALAIFSARKAEALRVLDLGTGTGCLLVALLSEFRQATGLGIDLSAEACAAATRNAEINGVGDRAVFRRGDWTEGLEEVFDLIVSNPPYIRSDAIAGLAREVRDHDPLLALDGGRDGLDPYRIFAATLARCLAPGGRIVLEIGAGQEAQVVALMQDGGFRHLGSRSDLGGHVRALIFGL